MPMHILHIHHIQHSHIHFMSIVSWLADYKQNTIHLNLRHSPYTIYLLVRYGVFINSLFFCFSLFFIQIIFHMNVLLFLPHWVGFRCKWFCIYITYGWYASWQWRRHRIITVHYCITIRVFHWFHRHCDDVFPISTHCVQRNIPLCE